MTILPHLRSSMPGDHRLAGVPGALHVDVQVGVPVLIALGKEVSQLADAGVRYQNVDGTKGGLGGLHPGLYTSGVGHVHTHRHGVLAQLGGQLLYGGAPGGQNHFGSVLEKGAGDALADALGGAGNEGGLSGQLTHSKTAPFRFYIV